MNIVNTRNDKKSFKSLRNFLNLETSKPKRNTLFTNTKREKKNSKGITAKHMVKGDVNVFVFKFVEVNNMINKRIIQRVNVELGVIEETFKFASDRVKGNIKESGRYLSNNVISNK